MTTTTNEQSVTESAVMPTTPGVGTMPFFPLDFGPLTTIPIDEQAKWALGGGTALSWVRQDVATLQRVSSIEELLALFRERLAYLESLAVLTDEQVAETMQLAEARREGKPVKRARSAGPLTVHSVIQSAVARPHGDPTEESIGDFFESAVHWVATAGGSALGAIVGGPAGALVGGTLATTLLDEIFG